MIGEENPYAWLTGGIGYWGVKYGSEKFATNHKDGIFSDYKDRPFDFDYFYELFPEFEPNEEEVEEKYDEDGNPIEPEEPQYSKKLLASVAKQAAFFVKPTWCRELDGPDRFYAFMLTVAHMMVLVKQQQSGLVGTSTPGHGATAMMDVMPGVMTSASVGGVSVSKTGLYNPRNMWESWYYQTPYGRTLLTFLEQQVASGLLYEGGQNIADCLRD